MKTIWVKTIPFNKPVVTTALESGVDAIWVEDGFEEKVKELGRIKTISKNGNIKLSQDVVEIEIKGKEDEIEAAKLLTSKTVIIKTTDWTIIPLENLIAQKACDLIVYVRNVEEAQTALQILEKGVDGILLETTDLNEIKRCANLVKDVEEPIGLAIAKITKVEPLGMGDRVCIDTCTNMKPGEGMLVGNSSQAMFLVHSESVENPYVEQRPFRVNAGAIHAYTLLPKSRTKYLSELKMGDAVLIVNSNGKTQTAIVGRIKIEKRPLMLVEGEINSKPVSLILQNAETIRLCRPDGSPVSVVSIEKGTEVLTYQEIAGRHFGMKIQETIVEK
ncbi:MAG: 3-dehydroquinate synthase II [bacterium]|nr:3-dehydroquinate synthase II [bacterium]